MRIDLEAEKNRFCTGAEQCVHVVIGFPFEGMWVWLELWALEVCSSASGSTFKVDGHHVFGYTSCARQDLQLARAEA